MPPATRCAPRALNSVGTSLDSLARRDIAMKTSKTILIILFGTLIANPTLSFAQVRDATSKSLGNYGRSVPSQLYAPAASSNTVAVPRPSASQAGRRTFSYDAAVRQAVPCDAAAQSAPRQVTRQPQPQAGRRFSYEPELTAPRSNYIPSRPSHGGVRDAASKMRGEY
jgi:hypothetical protein